MIPYHHTKAFGQVPCEDVAMRIPLPECWIYQFRNEKAHLSLSQLAAGNISLGSRMGAVKSSHRRAGKVGSERLQLFPSTPLKKNHKYFQIYFHFQVKGLERFLGTMETQVQDLMETSSGEAKYEHQHRSIVWRVPRLPKPGQGNFQSFELCFERLELN